MYEILYNYQEQKLNNRASTITKSENVVTESGEYHGDETPLVSHETLLSSHNDPITSAKFKFNVHETLIKPH